jgi:pilus assembly protein CpaD
MREVITYAMRGLCLGALMLAGSCATPTEPGASLDGDELNPILVQPSYQAIKVAYYPGRGLAEADSPRLTAFVDAYRDHGNGSLIVSAPAGMAQNVAIAYFADRINAMGISRDHIIVTTHDAAPGDVQVELNYVSYAASTNVCGQWTQDLSKTYDNDTPKNFGCAVQQNIAAMVADPRDLLGPRPMDDADARRRATVITKYDAGEPTAADKAPAQSGAVSDVNK